MGPELSTTFTIGLSPTWYNADMSLATTTFSIIIINLLLILCLNRIRWQTLKKKTLKPLFPLNLKKKKKKKGRGINSS